MAKIVSQITSIFVLVPAIAPSIGELILRVGDWRDIFLMLLLVSIIGFLWFAIRQKETLAKNKRIPIRPKTIIANTKEVISNSTTLRYTLAAALNFGAFIGYLASCQQIFAGYGASKTFALWFASFALTLGLASYFNSKLVNTLGMRALIRYALGIILCVSLVYLVYGCFYELTFFGFLLFIYPTFSATGILFGNLNAVAMEPMGHIAGIASAVIGFFQTLISVCIGGFIGQMFDGSPTALIAGYFFCSCFAYIFVSKRT